MRSIITKLLGAAAIALSAALPARAEVVENYRYDFKKTIDKADPAFAVASSWGHIVDSYTHPTTGNLIYQSYTQSSYSGHDGCGKIDIGSELLGNTKTCADMLVTPKLSGAVSLWCQSNLYSSTGTIRFYALKKLDDGTYEVGDEYTAQSNSRLPGYNSNQWVEIAFDPIADNAEYPYIGIHGHNARISDFNAERADIEKAHKLSVSNVRVNGPASGVVCDENNMATVSFDVTVLNIGDFSYDGTEENLTISVAKSGSDTPLNTFAIGALAEGASKTVTCALDPMPFSELGTPALFTIKENLTGNTAESSVTIKEYKPVLNFREDGGYSNVAATYVLDFGKLKGAATRKMTVNAQSGTAPAEITAIECPAGFSTDWELPRTLATTGTTPISITFDPEGIEAGTYAGELRFTVTGGDIARLAVSAVVVDPSLIYIPFADDKVLPSEIANGEGNMAWKLGYTGSGANRNNYIQPTSSYSSAELVLPKLTFSATSKLAFDARRTGTGAKIEFAYSTDRSNWTALPEASVTMNTDPALDYDFKTFQLNGMPEGDYSLKITGSEVYLDNIYGLPYAEVAHDMALTPAQFPASAMVNNLYTATVALKNYLTAAEEADGYKMYLIVDGNEYEAAEVPEVPGGQGVAEASVTFTPHRAGEFAARVEARFTDGTIFATPETTIAVAEEQINALSTIAPTSSQYGSQYVLPFNYSAKVFTEQIYPAEYVGLPAGTKINGIAFHGNTLKDYATHIEAWIGFTDDKVQSADKVPLLDVETLTKVFDGDYTFKVNSEKDWFLNLPFASEIVYDGTSSIVVYLRAISDNPTVYSFNFEAYNNGDAATRYLNYARWKIDTDGSLTGWDNHCVGYAALNLATEIGLVTGKVTEGEVPVEGAAVTLRSDNVEYYGTSDAEGAYTVAVLQSGRDYTATADAAAFKSGESAVSFAEGMAQTTDIAMLATKAAFYRGVPEAIVLPDVSAAPLGTYYRFDTVEGNTLVFRNVPSAAELVTDTPYILIPDEDCEADLSALTFGQAAGATEVGTTTLRGTYASRYLRDGEFLPSQLITLNGDAPTAQADATRKIARAAGAYVVTDILNPAIVLRGSVSGVENVAAEQATDGAVYTIDGRLVRSNGDIDNLPSGIYIINGHKVAIR